MKIYQNIILIFGILSLLLISACSTASTNNYPDLAKCLTEKGAKMYGTEWCPHCKNQKEMFGDAFMYVDYIDCELYQDKCLEADVRSYPTWIINGEKQIGEQSLYRLSSLTECPLS